MKIDNRKSLIIVGILAATSSLVHFGNANQVRGNPMLDFDSPYYVHLILWMGGEIDSLPPQPFRMRITVPALASLIYRYIGVNNAFGLINSILWIATVLIYFYAVRKLYDIKTATVTSVLFSYSVPVMVYGAAISTDMLGYLALAATTLYLVKSSSQETKSMILLGVLLYFATMGREVSILAIAYVFIYRILTDRKRFYSAVVEVFYLLVFAVLGLVTASLLIPQPGYTAYFYQALQGSLSVDKVLREAYQIIATYHIGWIFICWNLINVRRSEKDRGDVLFLTSLIVGSTFLIIDHFIGVISSRFVFLTYLGFIIAIYRGMESIRDLLCLKPKLGFCRHISWMVFTVYVGVGLIFTAESNLSFPTISDTQIAQLFPKNYPIEKLWRIKGE
ncbi:MAG: glycosyltransferase family 39 protein [Aigarchaeota archaeon]|nr:glycosyltransferase family 39 protein [Candidatus Calditenuis fumarioli]